MEEMQGKKVFGGGFLLLVGFRGRLVEWRAGQEADKYPSC